MGVLRVLDSSGDTAIAWDADVGDTVAEAEAAFEAMLAARRMAFGRAAGAPPDDAVLLRRFDSSLEEIIVVRPLQGG